VADAGPKPAATESAIIPSNAALAARVGIVGFLRVFENSGQRV
jgi:hypothetical protein